MKNLIDEEQIKLFQFFNDCNEQCKNKLEELRRNWLNIDSSIEYSLGKPIIGMVENTFIQIKSIYYSEFTSHEKLIFELMKSMRSWIVTMYNCKKSVAFLIKGDTLKIQLYISNYNKEVSRRQIEAAFPGVLFGEELTRKNIYEDCKFAGVFTGIPAYTNNEQEQLYSMNLLLRGLRGKNFCLIIAGNPLEYNVIQNELNSIKNEISKNHELIKQNLTKQFGEGTTSTFGVSINSFTSIMKAATEAITKTLSVSAGISYIVGLGISYAKSKMTSNTDGNASGSSTGLNYSYSVNKNKSHSDSLERINQFAAAYEEALNEKNERLNCGLSEGLWEATSFLLTEDFETLELASSLFKTALTSHFDVFEPFRFIKLKNKFSNWDNLCLNIPSVIISNRHENLSTKLTSSEFSALMSLPDENFPGIQVQETPRFGVNIINNEDANIEIGNICDREILLQNKFYLSKDSLNTHTLVCGLTGMGKSTTIREILRKCNLPFLIIEPAKSEYRNLKINNKTIKVYTAGDEKLVPLHINPFELPEGETLHGHIDSLAAVLNGAFPMEGPMAALVEQGLVRVYKNAGWDVISGDPPQGNKVPTMDSFYDALSKIIEEQQFQGDYGCNIKSALLTRINSLRIGPRGALFNNESNFSVKDILSNHTVIELKKVGSDETKAFLMGILLIRIYKYLEQKGNSSELESLLVIEEAHRIFRRSEGKNNSLIGNNTSHQTVEFFENIMSEVRAYGLGMMIVDQLPLRLSEGAIKNTNLKIIHRLGARDDAIELGGSMGLSPEKSAFINRLTKGHALIHYDLLNEPVHIKINLAQNSKLEYTDEELLKNNPHINLSDNRPPHFYDSLEKVEKKCPRKLEELADKFIFNIFVIPMNQKSLWNDIWEKSVKEIIPNLLKTKSLNLDKQMISHLFQYSIVNIFKNKKYLNNCGQDFVKQILSCLETLLLPDLNLNINKLQEIVTLMYSNEIYSKNKLPDWLPREYPELRKYYAEAKQFAMAIALKKGDEIHSLIKSEQFNKAVKLVIDEIFARCLIPRKSEILCNFIFALFVVLLDVYKPNGYNSFDYLTNLYKYIDNNANGES